MEWLDAIEFFGSSKFTKIVEQLKTEREAGKIIFPPRSSLLKAFALTPPDNVKVVILGQDPYPTKGHAHGLAFSVEPNISPLPKSLVNIYKELEDDIGTNRENGDLSDWAKQGVLLLNTSLTVVEGQPSSHSDIGWGVLTNEVVRFLSEHYEHLVFILWGKHAQQKAIYVDGSKHLIIRSPHPSPLSAHRGFFGSKPFTRANKYLSEHKKQPIRW